LLTKLDDPALRADLEREVAVLKEHLDFDLVLEGRTPEMVLPKRSGRKMLGTSASAKV